MPVPDHDADERIVWQGDYITAKTRGRWEYVGRPRNIRAAVILAVDDDDHVLLVEQYRVPLGQYCLELPAGLIGDEDERGDEDPLVAAGREQTVVAGGAQPKVQTDSVFIRDATRRDNGQTAILGRRDAHAGTEQW